MRVYTTYSYEGTGGASHSLAIKLYTESSTQKALRDSNLYIYSIQFMSFAAERL